jgi:hypothetical protein
LWWSYTYRHSHYLRKQSLEFSQSTHSYPRIYEVPQHTARIFEKRSVVRRKAAWAGGI